MNCNKESSRCANSWLRLLVLSRYFHPFPLKFGCVKISTRTVIASLVCFICQTQSYRVYRRLRHTINKRKCLDTCIMPSVNTKNVYCKLGYFRWGKISRKCWQDLSRGGNFHDTAPISFIKAYGFFFAWGLFSRKRQKREKRKNYPHAKISTFTLNIILQSLLEITCIC